MSATQILRNAAKIMEERGKSRDSKEGERSMKRTVDAFNAATGHRLSERDGWLFMVALKMARAASTSTGLADDYEDGAAYFALAGESVQPKDPKASPPREDPLKAYIEKNRSLLPGVAVPNAVREIPSGYRNFAYGEEVHQLPLI